MVKMIFKNLWNRRRQNAWLFVELILVTILTWIMTDYVTVGMADTALPMGYDVGRLVLVDVSSLPEASPDYKAEYDSVDANHRAVEAMMQHMRGLDGVERAAYMGSCPVIGGTSNVNTGMGIGEAIDTLVHGVNMVMFEPDTEFFETYGIKASAGSPTAAELSARRMSDYEIIISREYGELFWPGENALGKRFLNEVKDGDSIFTTVTGVVEGIRWISPLRSYCAVFSNRDPWGDRKRPVSEFQVVLRLGEGVDHSDFLNALRGNSSLRAGNFFVQTATDYVDLLYNTEEQYGIHTERRQMMLLSAFFLLNLMLGTIGCFWLQTNRRVEEIGVLRSFGARRSQVTCMLVAESVILTVAAFMIGALLYLQYAVRNGLADGFDANQDSNVIDNWVRHFGMHFTIISVIVLAILVVCVVIGTLIPAIRASRVNVSEALRDE
ncbi:MAG: FtsX-like permease family protein [Bacteroidales bacterium]|nr:FtsX-like permease family protein [Bacteroidales bacterium]